ncbi:ABC transporter permease [Paracidobacterium acidisoli]|uniref:Multidrug ABC transporter substrate-binding protein n=1 Tax=Paracidobacterium acidisoli TaxID=2303751 RepID=A0A372IJ90_9BACT|nr:ABC transporter permease [Paracidobacterium acidisoli]MBT9333340.1 ABC transporter permease [Paracidobacterium acidisoli]
MSWLRSLFPHRRFDDISISIEEHIAEKTEELMEEGMPREQAEHTARRAFGNVTLLRERSREVWQWQRLLSVASDLRLVFRRLWRSPAFTVTAILTLAIGIGANTAVFSVLDGVLLKPLPYSHPEQLVATRLAAPGAAGLANFTDGLRLSPSMYFTFSEQNRAFQSLGIWIRHTASVTGLAQPEEVRAISISDGVLESLEVPPAAGRWISHADQDPHGAKAVMLGYGYWQRRFGGDRSAIGRTLLLDAQPRLIVGVMPRGFRLVDTDFDLLVPLALDRNRQTLAGFAFTGIARLRPGVSIATANADIARMLPLWMDSWSNGPGTDSHWYEAWKITPSLRPLKQDVIGNVRSVLWVVMATIALVMIIVCANMANLLLVRAEARHLELSIRSALGAGRARIVRALLLESLTLGLIGGLFGVGFAYAGLRLLLRLNPSNLPRLAEISLDAPALLFTLALSLIAGLLFGSIPAWKIAWAPNHSALGSSRTSGASRERHRSRNMLVILQVALSLVLLIAAALMIRTFQRLRSVNPGFTDAGHLQTMRISIPESLIADSQTVARTQNEIADRLAAIPGVRSVGFATAVPMDGIESNWNLIFMEDRKSENDHPPLRLFNYASPNLFHTMGTRVLAGREFTWTDIYGGKPVVILSANLARELWGSPSAAIGKSIREFVPWHEVVGVVEDMHQNGVDKDAPAIVYWPTKQGDYRGADATDFSRSVTFALRTDRAGTESLVGEMEHAVWSVDANLPLASIQTMQEIESRSFARTSFTLVMLAIAGSMALLLGIIGIYGVISYTVSQQRREIGIRLALGAQKAALCWRIVGSALVLTGIGLAIGLCAAAGLAGLMKSLLFGISPFDPLTWCVIPLVLAAAAVMASSLPARRAAAIDPAEVLKAE